MLAASGVLCSSVCVLRLQSSKILQTLFNETKRLRKTLAVTWDEAEFCNLLTSTDWAPLQAQASERGRVRPTEPLAQMFTLVAQHPWAIGAAVLIDCLTREAARGGAPRHGARLWTTLLSALGARGLPPGTALVLCIDQVDVSPWTHAGTAAQWQEHWQTFTHAVAQAGLPALSIWAGTDAGLAAVRQAIPEPHEFTEHPVGALTEAELQPLLPRLVRALPRARREPWAQQLAESPPAWRLPAHLLLATTCAAATAEGPQSDAATPSTWTPLEPAALVQHLVQTVQHRQPAAVALFQQLLAILAFLPPGQEFMVDDIFPLCDLQACALDVVSGRAMLERLLGECVRYGLLEYETYTSRYRTGHSIIQQALQELVCATVAERHAVWGWRQLASAVIYHVRYGERELLPWFARSMVAAAGEAEAAARMAPYLVAPLHRILGQSTKAERQRIAEALGQFPSPWRWNS